MLVALCSLISDAGLAFAKVFVAAVRIFPAGSPGVRFANLPFLPGLLLLLVHDTSRLDVESRCTRPNGSETLR